jgi:hypothetical protein
MRDVGPALVGMVAIGMSRTGLNHPVLYAQQGISNHDGAKGMVSMALTMEHDEPVWRRKLLMTAEFRRKAAGVTMSECKPN